MQWLLGVIAALQFMRRIVESVSVQQELFGGPENRDERAYLHVETVMIRLGRIPFMDATGTHTLFEILALIGPDNVCVNMAEIARCVTQA